MYVYMYVNTDDLMTWMRELCYKVRYQYVINVQKFNLHSKLY